MDPLLIEYLVRGEQVGLHGAQVNEAEFFYKSEPNFSFVLHAAVLEIKVTGSGSGSGSTTDKILGLYNDNMTLFNGLNLGKDTAKEIKSDIAQTLIGDEVWTGGSSSASGSSVVTPSASTPPAYAGLTFSCGSYTGNSAKFRSH
ncbi:fungal cellulose binding domain protein [Penicillium daleae]|uniref:Fungal cellulose binding domain protein n=1 Tax=Penicillium daleae TaxID=63821 RepID=A0AAD6FXN9_9EURO|nr:fungal cellulose binding domain protein [Penicillium daleae]KAJ5432525.1 fungal cellulose binding domain protein [Penicillium daleae]